MILVRVRSQINVENKCVYNKSNFINNSLSMKSINIYFINNFKVQQNSSKKVEKHKKYASK